MKKILLALAVLAVAITGTAYGAAPEGNKIRCEADCVLLSPNRAQVDTLNGTNGYGVVYTESTVALGASLSDISKLGFNYSGTEPYGGAPRISIGIDEDGVAETPRYEAFAFVDAAGCNDGAGKVDVINDPTCTVWYGPNSYVNWAAFVAANPTYTVGYEYTFVVADAPGSWTIWNVQLGAKSRGGK